MSPQEHLRNCIERAEAHAEALSVALLARRDVDALAEAAVVDETLPLAGDVLTVKACFDVAGWTTHAGSAVLADAPPASADAPMVAALRAAGATLLAQTNMTEFAYGALGLNSTYGTPTTPLRPGEHRVAGGSTSGGAVAVALGIADLSLGSDTSGSIRIPAAFCGVAGFKPSQGRYPADGLIPLAKSFDAPGLIASTAARLHRVDLALVDRDPKSASVSHISDAHLLVPGDAIRAGQADPEVLECFDHWLEMLAAAGVRLTETELPMLTEAALAAREGSMIAVEAYDWHRRLIADRFDLYDPRVGSRIVHGSTVLAANYVAAQRIIGECRRRYDEALDGADGVVTPAVPIMPPRIADVETMADYLAMNTEVLRLTEFANRLDLPSVTVPGVVGPGVVGSGNLDDRSPIGLMLTGKRGGDAALLDLAVLVERCICTTE
jgi:aspartyl-tRNA(Asn)/glutamyl-tRNA(Gln) amidotransferase subunit A